MRVKYNEDNDFLFCIGCKNHIHIGERYAVVTEEYLDEKIKKEFHLDCVPVDEDSDESINRELDLNSNFESDDDYPEENDD